MADPHPVTMIASGRCPCWSRSSPVDVRLRGAIIGVAVARAVHLRCVTKPVKQRMGDTMQSRLAPTDDEWRIAMINHRRGTHVNGTVLSHHAFGFFVDLRETVNGLVEAPCIMDRRPGEDGYSDDFPPLAPTSRRSCSGLPNIISRSGSACVRQISLATAGNQTPRRTSAG